MTTEHYHLDSLLIECSFTFSPLVNITVVHTLDATLETFAGKALAGPRAPTATIAQWVANVSFVLWKYIQRWR